MSYVNMIEKYLLDSFGGEVDCNLLVDDKDQIPLFLSLNYDYYKVRCLDIEFVLMHYILENEISVSKLKNHMDSARKYLKIEGNMAFGFSYSSNYVREKLTREKLSFIILGKQIYLPFIGAVFTDTVQKKYLIKEENQADQSDFFPSTEGLALHLVKEIYAEGFSTGISQKDIALATEMSQMSVSRGYKELAKKGWIDIFQNGKHKSWKFKKSYNSLIKQMIVEFKNPILKTIYIEKESINEQLSSKLIQAGETELSILSDIAPPINDVYAISKKEWNELKGKIKELPTSERNSVKIELWKYKVPIKDGRIDRVALYISLKDIEDERVKQALEYLLEKVVFGIDDGRDRDI